MTFRGRSHLVNARLAGRTNFAAWMAAAWVFSSVLLGTVLPGKGGPAEKAAAGASPAIPDKSAEVNRALQYKIQLAAFDRDRMDLVLERISRQIGVPIELVGPDLQLDGITKNQSFGWNEPELTVDETLRKIFLKANSDGHLVYQVKPKAAGGRPIIYVTTRAAAIKRGEQLPAVFTAPPTVAGLGDNNPKPKNAADALKFKMALSFERNSLDSTLGLLSRRIGVPIEINGPDLQFEGITKNQSLALDEPKQTVDKLLRKILRKANPAGDLVYQVKPKAPGGPEIIFVTTRQAVKKRGEKLLPVFETAPPRK
jgi:hypothetical protein